MGIGATEEVTVVQDSIQGNAVVTITDVDGNVSNAPLIISTDIDLYAETKDLDFGHPDKEKYVDRFYFDLTAPAGKSVTGITVEIGYRDSLDDVITWLDPEAVSLDNPSINIRLTARYFRIRIRDELPLAQWKLARIDVYGRVMGGRLQ